MVVACRFMGKLMVIKGSEYIITERLRKRANVCPVRSSKKAEQHAETAVASSDLKTQESSLLNSSRTLKKLFPNLVGGTLAVFGIVNCLEGVLIKKTTLVGRTCD